MTDQILQNTTEAVRLRIVAWMDSEGVSLRALARRAEVAEGSLRFIRKATWRPSLATVRRIEDIIPNTFNVDLPARR